MKLYKMSAIAFLFLGACTPEVTDWTPAESPKKNVVDRAVFSHTVHYPAHSSSMGNREKRALQQFLRSYIMKPSSVTVILEEFGGHSEKRVKDIERELVLFGISYHLIKVGTLDEMPKGASKGHKHDKGSRGSGVELTFERYIVIPPSCGNFSQPIGDAEQAYNHSNYGCADTANLGMMVANPRDLMNGRTLEASDGTVIAAGVQRYRTDKVKALIDTSTTVSPEQASSSSQTPTMTSGGTGAGAY